MASLSEAPRTITTTWLSVFLYREKGRAPVFTTMELSIKLPSGELGQKRNMIPPIMFGGDSSEGRGWNKFVSKGLLSTSLDNSGTLTLHAELSVTLDVNTTLLPVIASKPLDNLGLQSMAKDFGSMLETGLQR